MTRAALYEKHAGLADAIAQEWFLPGADMDDVHQEARVALWIATGTYKPEKGLRFATYARHAIKADLRDKVQSANRHKHRVLTDADRDERQLALLETAPVGAGGGGAGAFARGGRVIPAATFALSVSSLYLAYRMWKGAK